MKLIAVDKSLYRQRMNRLIVVFVGSLALLSVLLGSGLIALFGVTPLPGAQSTGNFHWNLLGVLLALGFCSAVLHSQRRHAYLHEVLYVWQLKQWQNRIYRKLIKVKAAAAKNDVNALIILTFYYESLHQVYLLDDNTLTLPALTEDRQALSDQVASLGLSISAEQFEPNLLQSI